MHTAKLSNISWRALHVWRRNGEVLLTTWYTNFLPPLLEPVFYVLAFGFGIGGMAGRLPVESKMNFVSSLSASTRTAWGSTSYAGPSTTSTPRSSRCSTLS